jgi:regulator of RNase E activity RraB
MSKKIFAFVLAACAFSQADTVFIDNSMAASQKSDTDEYEERFAIGPYVEFTNIKMGNVNWSYKVNNRKYDINVSNTYTFGGTGILPFNNYIGIYAILAYQFLGVDYQDRNLKEGYRLQEEMEIEYDGWNVPVEKEDVKGHHKIHIALAQIGVDFGVPLFTSYNYQFMCKLYGFAGGITGKTFFQNDSKYLAPAIWGYTYGAGLRIAFHALTIAGGIRNTHEYFHTYYEQPISDNKDGDEFMLDFDAFLQPYVNFTIDLF